MKSMHAHTKTILIAIAALFAITIGALFITSQTFARAWTLATTQQTEGYSALSFVDTGHLPQYSAAGKQQHVSFSLINHEGQPTTYQYIATMTIGSTAQTVAQGNVTLGSNQNFQKTILYTVPKPNQTAHITVRLQNRSEYVSFETKS